jgi:hypothetical protein
MRSSSSLNQREALQLASAAVAAGHQASAVALDGPGPATMLKSRIGLEMIYVVNDFERRPCFNRRCAAAVRARDERMGSLFYGLIGNPWRYCTTIRRNNAIQRTSRLGMAIQSDQKSWNRR